MNSQIEALYARHGADGIRPRFVRPLVRLAHDGPMTISDLARSLAATHSATSQTVTAMKKADLVAAEPGPDARTQVVALTERATALVPLLEAEWRATDAVVARLDDELDGAVTHLTEGLTRRFDHRTMAERLDDAIRRQP